MAGEKASDQERCCAFGKANDSMDAEHQQQDGLPFRLARQPQLHSCHKRGNHTRGPATQESADRTALVPAGGGVPFQQAEMR